MLGGLVALWGGSATVGFGQEIGDQAEMDRLEHRAEDSIAKGDAEGAAMSMGRAALMAQRLAGLERDDKSVTQLFRGLERLYRAQEHAYRALALFERAGGQRPASSGVCATMRLASRELAVAREVLDALADRRLRRPYGGKRDDSRAAVTEWEETIHALRGDFDCPT